MNASTRRYFYLACGLIAAVVPILAQTGVITFDQSDAWVAALASVAGGGAALTAAHHTNKQISEGMHDPPLDPVDQVLQAIPAVLAQQQQANANVDRLRHATGDLLIESLPEDDAVQQVLESILKGTP